MRIEHCINPLSVDHDLIVLPDPGEAITPHQIIARNALAFSRPTICYVDGMIWGRADWDCMIPQGALVRFVEYPRGGTIGRIVAGIGIIALSIWAPYALGIAGTTLGAVTSAGISIVGSLLMAMLFPMSITAGEADSTSMNSLTGSNRLRVGEPFAERFGRTKFYPDLAMAAYVARDLSDHSDGIRSFDNAQRLYSLMIIGWGYYDVEGIYIDETPIDDYDEVEYHVLPPGGADPSLVNRVVYVCDEVNNQELHHEDYSTYVINPRGTLIHAIEYEIACSSGLIGHIGVRVDARTIDDDGAPLTAWEQIHSWNSREVTHTGSFGLCWRLAAPYGNGRYEVRFRRSEEATSDTDNIEAFTLVGVRGIGRYTRNLDDATLLEVVVKATNQLNGDVANRINVVATRKLYPVTATGFGSTLTATRSIIDAVAYMVTDDNGGRQSDSILVWDELYALRAQFASEGYYFDWAFASRCSVMDATAKAAKCAMAVPYTPGGLFSLAADREQSAPSMAFTGGAAIDKDSLTVTTKFKNPYAYDHVLVKYIDTETWQEASVECSTSGGRNNPYEITLEGCTSRTAAYKVGMRAWKEIYLPPASVQWTTGLMGHLPTLFSWVTVGEEMIDWGQTGVLAAVEPGLIWLSEPVDFDGEDAGWLMVHCANGNVAGPYTVGPTAYAHCVTGTIPDFKNIEEQGLSAAPYIFGPASTEVMVIRITGIAPDGRNQITLTGDVVNVDVYDLSTDPPELGSGIDLDPLETVSIYLESQTLTTQRLKIGWSGSGDSFKVEYSVNGGSSYSVLYANTTVWSVFVNTANVDVIAKVTPYIDGTLMTALAKTETYEYTAPVSLGIPANFDLQSFLAASVILTWDRVDDASGYKIYVGSTSGFDPATEGTLKYSGAANSATVALNLVAPFTYYLKVAATNAVFKDASNLNFSSALRISSEGGAISNNAGSLILTTTGEFIYA